MMRVRQSRAALGNAWAMLSYGKHSSLVQGCNLLDVSSSTRTSFRIYEVRHHEKNSHDHVYSSEIRNKTFDVQSVLQVY